MYQSWSFWNLCNKQSSTTDHFDLNGCPARDKESHCDVKFSTGRISQETLISQARRQKDMFWERYLFTSRREDEIIFPRFDQSQAIHNSTIGRCSILTNEPDKIGGLKNQ